jgi:hypothetical protein
MLLMLDVNYQMLDIKRNEESLHNDADILDSILNVCLFRVNGCCVNCQWLKLSLTKEIWEVWFEAWTSIHLVYVRIPGKGISHVLASIQLVYVRIPGKGITMYWLAHHVLTSIHLVYVRIPGKGITLHRLLHGDDDNSEIGIGNVLSGNNHGWSYEILNGGW